MRHWCAIATLMLTSACERDTLGVDTDVDLGTDVDTDTDPLPDPITAPTSVTPVGAGSSHGASDRYTVEVTLGAPVQSHTLSSPQFSATVGVVPPAS